MSTGITSKITFQELTNGDILFVPGVPGESL